MYTMKYAAAWLRRHAGREQRTEKCEKEESPRESSGNNHGWYGTDSSSALCLRYYQRAVSPSDILSESNRQMEFIC